MAARVERLEVVQPLAAALGQGYDVVEFNLLEDVPADGARRLPSEDLGLLRAAEGPALLAKQDLEGLAKQDLRRAAS